MIDIDDLLDELQAMGSPVNVAGMTRFGITGGNLLGISVVALRKLAKRVGRDHALAQQLWDSGWHEARLLASMVDDPDQVDKAQMEAWVSDFDSWDVCDQCCSNLFVRTPLALEMIREWIVRDEEYVRRAGFALMATTAVHGKTLDDAVFVELLTLVDAGADDERNFVKKAVNWALRQIGKRNEVLHAHAVELAATLSESPGRARRWIGRDALREFTDDKTVARLQKRPRAGPSSR